MNKSEFIDAIAAKVGMPKSQVAKFIDAYNETVVKTVAKGQDVRLIGFGTFAVTKRAARTGRILRLAPRSRSLPPRLRSSPRVLSSALLLSANMPSVLEWVRLLKLRSTNSVLRTRFLRTLFFVC